MLRIHLKYYLIFLCASILFSCRKKEKENEAPSVQVYNPGSNSFFNIGDTINLNGYASDDKELKTISMGITDQNYITVIPFVSQSASGTSFSFQFKYELDNIHLVTGNYYIIVKANDGEKENRAYIPIHITTSPFIKLAYYFISDNGLQTKADKTDTLFNYNGSINKTGKFIHASISSYYQQLFINGSINQNAICYNTNTGNQQWLLTNYGAGQDYFTQLCSDDRYFYIGTTDGSIIRYLDNGAINTIFTYSDPTYYPSFFYKHSQYYFSVYENPVIFSKKIITHYSAGASYQEIPFNFQLIGMSDKDASSAFVALNNVSGKAEVKILNAISNTLSSTFTLPNAKLLSFTAIDNDNLLLSMNDGNIYKYTYSTSNCVSIETGSDAQLIKFDKNRNELIVARGSIASLYHVNPFSLTSLGLSFACSDSIRDAFVLFNK